MSVKNLILFIHLTLLACCNNQQREVKSNDGSATRETVSCYRYIHIKDTVHLKIININNAITGNLSYNLFEKDKNNGTIQGNMKGDLLIADYTFNAEGSTSVRQVVFKIRGNTLMEGYGETREENGKMVFANIDSLEFGQSILLDKINCNE